jgi:hypothetical protein
MMYRVLAFSVLLSSCLALPAIAGEAGQGWQGIKKMMSAKEFKAAGLDRLTPAEIEALDDWMLRFLAHESQQVVRTDEKVQALQNAPVRRRINGTFKGWSGDTTFVLDNGEVWRQRLPGRYAVTLENPEVEISKNLLGFYELKVVATGRRVGVKRVK